MSKYEVASKDCRREVTTNNNFFTGVISDFLPSPIGRVLEVQCQIPRQQRICLNTSTAYRNSSKIKYPNPRSAYSELDKTTTPVRASFTKAIYAR